MGITVSDIRKAILGGGDASTFAPVLHEALGKAPIPSIASLERPLALPETQALLKCIDGELERLLTSWLEGREFSKQPPEKLDLMLIEVAPYGQNIACYLESVISEVKPDVLALDISPLAFSANMLYAMSLPSACGLPGYGEVRLEGSEKPFSREIFYPGSMNETVIIKSWLGKIPLLPTGMPRAPESSSLVADEDVADEEMSGMRLRTAYSAFEEALANAPDLKFGGEQGEGISRSLENTLSISMTRKLQREAHYSASRILDIASLLGDRGKAAKLLVIVDIKHSFEIRRALGLLSQGITDRIYLPPRNYGTPKATMLERHFPELNEYAKEFLPRTTLTQEIFRQALGEASIALQKETLTEEAADELISEIVQRTRIHPLITRGASVRGSIALKELLLSLCQIEPGPNRDSLEKVALIALPPRITLKPGVKESRIGIVSDIVKEVLYKISFSKVIYQYEVTITDVPPLLSIEDIAEALEDLIKKVDEKLPARDKMMVISNKTDARLLKALEAGKFLKKVRPGEYFLTKKSVEHLTDSLSQKLRSGEIAGDEYEREKARLEEMLPGTGEPPYQMSKRELVQIIMDFMDVVDKQVEKEWGKDINYLRLYTYYQMRQNKPDPHKTDHMHLKLLIDDMEKQGILKTRMPEGDRILSGTALNILVAYLGMRDPRLRHLKESLNERRAWVTERSQGVKRFSTGSVFRDISFRHTLKEIARQRKVLRDVRGGDFRVYLKRRYKPHYDIVLCVDTSGSMAEQRKIIYARLAAGVIAKEAAANEDRIGIVAFDDLGQTNLPLHSRNREVVNDYIVALPGLGATNIGDGIKCAADLLLNESNHNKKRIVLITDGEPNAITEEALAELKEKSAGDLTQESALIETRRASAQGIIVSVVYLTDGKGTGSEFVRSVAKAGRGNVTTITCHDELGGGYLPGENPLPL